MLWLGSFFWILFFELEFLFVVEVFVGGVIVFIVLKVLGLLGSGVRLRERCICLVVGGWVDCELFEVSVI